MMSLSGKVIAITGGASGLGKATALRALKDGAAVAVADLSEEALGELQEAAVALPGTLFSLLVDVSDESGVAKFADSTVSQFGRVDGVMVSAGITQGASVLDMPVESWRRVIEVNLTGAFFTMQRFARKMVDQGDGGSIVTVTSALAFTGQRDGVNYAASKGGVLSMTKTFALELGVHRIRFNNIAPGATDTPLLRRTVSAEFIEQWISRAPLGRLGLPDDHAAVACFLLSEDSEWITGQTFHVNGGSIMP
jgi:NAD(P)-dependent dehydrogenase (short-subunit alcohol dehydrogenase family)